MRWRFWVNLIYLSTKTGDTTSCVQVGHAHCSQKIDRWSMFFLFCQPSDSIWEIFSSLSSSSARSRHLSGESRTHQGRFYLQMKCLPTNQNLNFSSNSEANLNAKHLLTKWSFRVSLEKLGDEASLESTRFSKINQIIIFQRVILQYFIYFTSITNTMFLAKEEKFNVSGPPHR